MLPHLAWGAPPQIDSERNKIGVLKAACNLAMRSREHTTNLLDPPSWAVCEAIQQARSVKDLQLR